MPEASLAATGATGLTLERARAALALDSDFQTWCDEAGDAVAAATHTHDWMTTADQQRDIALPYCLIRLPFDESPSELTRIAMDTDLASVRLEFEFGKDIPVAYLNDGPNTGMFLANENDTIVGFLAALHRTAVSGVQIWHSGVQNMPDGFPALTDRREQTDDASVPVPAFDSYVATYLIRFGITAESEGE